MEEELRTYFMTKDDNTFTKLTKEQNRYFTLTKNVVHIPNTFIVDAQKPVEFIEVCVSDGLVIETVYRNQMKKYTISGKDYYAFNCCLSNNILTPMISTPIFIRNWWADIEVDRIFVVGKTFDSQDEINKIVDD